MAQSAPANQQSACARMGTLDGITSHGQGDLERNGIPDPHGSAAARLRAKQAHRAWPRVSEALAIGARLPRRARLDTLRAHETFAALDHVRAPELPAAAALLVRTSANQSPEQFESTPPGGRGRRWYFDPQLSGPRQCDVPRALSHQ